MPTLSQVINALLQLDHPPREQPGNPAPTTVTRTHLHFAGAPAPDWHNPWELKAELLPLLTAVVAAHRGNPAAPRALDTASPAEGAIHAASEAGRGSERQQGINAALSSDNLPSTCSLHSRHFVTRTLPARVISLTRRWRTRQSGSELNLGYPQGTGSCFVRPGWSNKGS